MKDYSRIFIRLSLIFAGCAVICGAFGSHLLKGILGDYELSVWDTAVKYLMFHALGILILSINHRHFNKKLLVSLSLLSLGIVIFSGTLFLLATRNIWGDDSYKFLGAITPVGGLSMIIGWFFTAVFCLNKSEETEKKEEHSQSKKRHHRRTESEESK
ncbi:MAG: DUF423 domain-containing protein [Bacteroidia bacterium]